MTTTIVGPGETSDGAMIQAGDTQEVYGTANNAIVYASGTQDVWGHANNTTITSGGYQFVENGGASYSTLIEDGGVQYLQQYIVRGVAILPSEGLGANGTTINAGGVQTDNNRATDTVINNGGIQNVSGYAVNTTINDGGIQNVNVGGAQFSNYTDLVNGTVINSGGLMNIVSGSVSNTHLMIGGEIAFQSLSYAEGGTVSYDAHSGTLSIADNGQATSLHLEGDYSTTAFVLSSADGHVAVTAVSLCFCRGTLVATPSGEVAVEMLRVGDLVACRGDVQRAIRWIGSSCGIVTPESRPVVVRANAFSDGVPKRDLRVTAGHSFLFQDVLIPIGKLINGRTIMWDAVVRTVEVFHVELDVHDILSAEGALAESYRDDGNRVGFEQPSGRGRAPRSMPSCAPIVIRGPVIDRTSRFLERRADALAQAEHNCERLVA